MRQAAPMLGGDPGAHGLREPLPADLRRLLRRAALDHALAERRRRHLPVVHCGTPGEPHPVFAVSPEDVSDHAVRTDVVAALAQRARRPGRAPLVWLARPGSLETQDVDLAWLAAAAQAYAEAGLPLVFVVVNRTGWRDPRSQSGRTWARLRRR